MTTQIDPDDADLLQPAATPGSNLAPYTVGELARAVKRTVEGEFGQVRVRGELLRVKRHTSGHIYLCLKDDDATLDAVVWRSGAGRLGLVPEDGMEVICTGRLTTYAAKSTYQLVIESMEPAGQGALLKMIEDRRKRLEAEGLFAADRKRTLPTLPSLIGVITSPTGAVIRDILHRLEDRFPTDVLIWPVAVQGQNAAAEITAAIEGFNALPVTGCPRRPDLLIVARGGGALEDLMPFNEENVVRAAANSTIPLISAVGHETDTTLIDFASDRRAPTPTAAAEFAVPVRLQLLARVADSASRLRLQIEQVLELTRSRLAALGRGLGNPRHAVEAYIQRLDGIDERLDAGRRNYLSQREQRVATAAARLRHPKQQLDSAAAGLVAQARALDVGFHRTLDRAAARFDRVGDLNAGFSRTLDQAAARLDRVGALLESYSYRGVLKRGFALVTDATGHPVGSAAATAPGQKLDIELHDGLVGVTVDGEAKPKAGRSQKPQSPPPTQGRLL